MEPQNQPFVRRLTERVKREIKSADIWVYSGYTIEELLGIDNNCHTEDTMAILRNMDILVDGEFHIDEKNIMLRFRGSSNQRIINVPETLARYNAGIEEVILEKKYMDK